MEIVSMPIKIVCPSVEDLSVIINQVQCPTCNAMFKNHSQFRMHDLKVHKQQKLDKCHKENIQYHCPVDNCVYSVENQKHFKLYKYLKQHYLKVHAVKQFTCVKCTKSFSTNAAKEAHLKICGMNFTCRCQKVYNSYEALLTHAKRKSHKIDQIYKLTKNKNKVANKEKAYTKLIYILPKPTCDVAVQTEETIKKKPKCLECEIPRKQIGRQTQTNDATKDNQSKICAETQTATIIPGLIRVHEEIKYKKIDEQSIESEEIIPLQTESPKHLLPDSLLVLEQDVDLKDIWEEPVKSSFTFTSGTQTSPEKNAFDVREDHVGLYPMYHRSSKSDPMLTEKIYSDKFNSTETQTEEEYCRSIFESDPLSSNNETQTPENFTESMEPLICNDTCTQTCEEIFSSALSDIQTQTAWSHSGEISASVESRTKISKCSNCSDSITIHMETQTDLLDMFEDLR
ncbi:oocyte zinc finger protein XlCOF28 [Copidosoma floridanum]|uniref:oocyte zinc finger protein XlCOF28 n=1 Tax=Copidosoma floridanum TaxID=29053 RepID=UPI000C6FBFCA|nr:oocyte zinc finger protein XlCOF28 [Copidosoma floridanum]